MLASNHTLSIETFWGKLASALNNTLINVTVFTNYVFVSFNSYWQGFVFAETKCKKQPLGHKEKHKMVLIYDNHLHNITFLFVAFTKTMIS